MLLKSFFDVGGVVRRALDSTWQVLGRCLAFMRVVRELWSVSKAFELDEWRIAGVVWDMVDQVFEGNRKTRAYLARDVRVR